MAEAREGKITLNEDELREAVLSGAKAAYEAVATTYGPRGKNVLIERGFGRPTFTRDGLTVVEQVYFKDRPKNSGAQILAEASRSANNVSGDGSSATVVLAYHLLKNSVQAIASGIHPMDISETLVKDSYLMLDELKKLAIPVKDEQLKEVATVSAGDPLLGQLIAEAILHVGRDGGIITEKAMINEIEREYINGYYMQSGFTALQSGKKELIDPYVVVSNKRLSSGADAAEILNGIVQAKNIQKGQIPRILFIGNFEDAAYTAIVNHINAGMIDAVVIKAPPMYGEYGKYLLEDIALYAGCSLITESTNIKQFIKQMSANSFYSPYIGTVDKVVANKSESTIFAPNDSEAIVERIAELKKQLKDEPVPAIAEKIRDRIAKLEGKIAIFKIGAPQDSSKEEIEFRVEDAINSTRHAYNDGIVAGGGVTLLELSKLKVSDVTRKALQSTFQQLLINANLPAELKLKEALDAPKGHGFNLRKDDKLVDMVKDGVIDPYIVAREVITHATHQIAETVKLGFGIFYTDDEKK